MIPSPSAHTATLIFLHGLGDSANGGWRQTLPELQSAYPGLKVILPNAPTKPIDVNGGMRMQAWFNLKAFVTLETKVFDYAGLDEARATVESIVAEEVAAGTPANRIILGGFSQGAAIAQYAGLQSETTLGGIFALSGYLPGFAHVPMSDFVQPANKETPLFIAHGEQDRVIVFPVGKKSALGIKEVRPTNFDFKNYAGMGHHSSEAEMSDLTKWILKVLA